MLKQIKFTVKMFLSNFLERMEYSRLSLQNEYLILMKKLFIDTGTYGKPIVKYYDPECKSIVKIGKYCSISTNVCIIVGADHNSDFISTFPFWIFDKVNFSCPDDVKTSRGDVLIGSDVWIGRDVLIRDGVTIGDGAVIGACSVVTRDVKPYEIVAGVPACHLRFRFNDDQIKALLNIKWWEWSKNEIIKNQYLLLSNKIDEFIRVFGYSIVDIKT